jgi:predicted dehydrogenase
LISGTEGALTVPKLELYRYDGERKGWGFPLLRERIAVDTSDPLVRQIRHFCQVIRGEVEPKITGHDAVRTLIAVQAVFEAARTGHTIELFEKESAFSVA